MVIGSMTQSLAGDHPRPAGAYAQGRIAVDVAVPPAVCPAGIARP
jgi:hypothetical protein